jgi:hypothetical protein
MFTYDKLENIKFFPSNHNSLSGQGVFRATRLVIFILYPRSIKDIPEECPIVSTNACPTEHLSVFLNTLSYSFNKSDNPSLFLLDTTDFINRIFNLEINETDNIIIFSCDVTSLLIISNSMANNVQQLPPAKESNWNEIDTNKYKKLIKLHLSKLLNCNTTAHPQSRCSFQEHVT